MTAPFIAPFIPTTLPTTQVNLASLSLLGIHLSFIFMQMNPIIEMIWLGVTYSLCAASLWPMVAMLVKMEQLGTAYGAMTAIQNLGIALVPLIVGKMLETADGSDPTLEQYYRVQCVLLAIPSVDGIRCARSQTPVRLEKSALKDIRRVYPICPCSMCYSGLRDPSVVALLLYRECGLSRAPRLAPRLPPPRTGTCSQLYQARRCWLDCCWV